MARPKPDVALIPRSFRTTPDLWEKAKQRAKNDGTTVSAAIADLLEGYARGIYDLPRIKVTVTKKFPTDD